MYSVYDDTVLDPFWGTGTTSLAAMVAGRNSVGVERDPAFVDAFDDRVRDVPSLSRDVNGTRLESHREFVAETRAAGDELGYENEFYDVPVRTKQERGLRLYDATAVETLSGDGSGVEAGNGTGVAAARADRTYRVTHELHE